MQQAREALYFLKKGTMSFQTAFEILQKSICIDVLDKNYAIKESPHLSQEEEDDLLESPYFLFSYPLDSDNPNTFENFDIDAFIAFICIPEKTSTIEFPGFVRHIFTNTENFVWANRKSLFLTPKDKKNFSCIVNTDSRSVMAVCCKFNDEFYRAIHKNSFVYHDESTVDNKLVLLDFNNEDTITPSIFSMASPKAIRKPLPTLTPKNSPYASVVFDI